MSIHNDHLHHPHCISRVLDQNGVSQAWYIAEIHHSGWEPLNWKALNLESESHHVHTSIRHSFTSHNKVHFTFQNDDANTIKQKLLVMRRRGMEEYEYWHVKRLVLSRDSKEARVSVGQNVYGRLLQLHSWETEKEWRATVGEVCQGIWRERATVEEVCQGIWRERATAEEVCQGICKRKSHSTGSVSRNL